MTARYAEKGKDTSISVYEFLDDYAQGRRFPTIDSSTVKIIQVSEDEDSMSWKKI